MHQHSNVADSVNFQDDIALQIAKFANRDIGFRFRLATQSMPFQATYDLVDATTSINSYFNTMEVVHSVSPAYIFTYSCASL